MSSSESSKSRKLSREMLIRNFRAAAKGHGEYCPIKNELRVRKGRKVYRFTCGEYELRFAAPGREEVVLLLAPDAKVSEFRRCIADLTNSTNGMESGKKKH